jgi:hypothetical protein
MPRRFRLLCCCAAAVFCGGLFVPPAGSAAGGEPPPALPFPAIPQARDAALAAAAALRSELATGPLDGVLARELDLDWLDAALARSEPDPAELARLERSLRRILPSGVQQSLDGLRDRVGRLARVTRLAAEGPAAAEAARARLERHLGGSEAVGREAIDGVQTWSPETDASLRQAFATLSSVAATSADEQELRLIRGRLSTANVSVLVKRGYVEAIGRQSFSQPVEFHQQREGATISGRGQVTVELSVRVPESRGVNRLFVEARGTGSVAATADRRRVHVSARAVPDVTGREEVRLTPRRVEIDPPQVTARFTTRLAGLRIDGLLGRCRLVQRIAGRAVQEALAGNDPAVARQIEQAIAPRIEEEAASLAYRVNGLVQWGVWDRLAALDFLPEVQLANDSLGLRSDTWYARADQLGGIAPRPALPAADLARLDMVTWVHESALNNTLATVGSLRLDEATVRGLWEVQAKLWSPEWDALPPARIPAVITLAEERPLVVTLSAAGIEVVLWATACELAGRVVDEEPREIRLEYEVVRDANHWQFRRGDAAFTGPVPAEIAAAWEETLGLFFGRRIEPLPRYRPSGLAEHLTLGYVAVHEGWLVAGAERVPTAAGAAGGEGLAATQASGRGEAGR